MAEAGFTPCRCYYEAVREERSHHILTVPNSFTILRLALIPVILWQMLGGRFGWALGLSVAAGVSDFLDGLSARALHQKSLFGMYLDPVADKLLLSSSFLVLAITGQVRWVVAGLVLGRDAIMIVTVVVLVLTTSLRRFPPTLLGKANTLFQMVAVYAVMLDIVYGGEWLRLTRRGLMVLVAVLVIASAVQYTLLTVRKLADRGRVAPVS